MDERGIKSRDLVTWALLAGILWQLSRQNAPRSSDAYGLISTCCDPCGVTPGKNIAQPPSTPYWITQLGQQTGSRFIFEAH